MLGSILALKWVDLAQDCSAAKTFALSLTRDETEEQENYIEHWWRYFTEGLCKHGVCCANPHQPYLPPSFPPQKKRTTTPKPQECQKHCTFNNQNDILTKQTWDSKQQKKQIRDIMCYGQQLNYTPTLGDVRITIISRILMDIIMVNIRIPTNDDQHQ